MEPMQDHPLPEPALPPAAPEPNEARRAIQAGASGFVLGLLLALAARRAKD
jgi:hypothetical protein